ncbi:MAG: enoyl-CoA hydratase-related protein [Gammaproteobacteria bacterium]
MTKAVLLHEIDARGVATVTLNRPEVNNAYNAELVSALLDTFSELASNPGVRVVVIRGNGKHFQAGADLNWLRSVASQDEQANIETSRRTAKVVRGLNEFPKPTVALIHGACIGGGTGVAAACDVVIASADASFAISEARWGLFASVIFPQLNAAIGERNVRRYAITCERFGAQKALQMGLVHEVCETGKLDEAVKPIIESILIAGPKAVAQTKQVVMHCAGSHMDEALFEELVASHAAKRQTAEAYEGFQSFDEKRDPNWFPGA